MLNVVVLVVAVGVVIIVVAFVVIALGGGVDYIIGGINCLFSYLLYLIWLLSVVKKTFFTLFTSEMCSFFRPLPIWKSMFLFDDEVCFMLTGLDDVDFTGVVSNFEQMFAFCLSVTNGISKNDFILSSSRRKETPLSGVWMRSSIITSQVSFWELFLFRSLL